MFENLVFEGGGVKGMVYIGATKALEKLGLLANIHRYAGSSIGALFAACLSMGCSSAQLEEWVGQGLPEVKTPSVLDMLIHFTRTCGIVDIEILRQFVVKVVAHKVDPSINLLQLYNLTHNDLVIVATDLSQGEYLYLCHQQTPNVLLVDALIASMAIPVIFSPFRHSSGGFWGDAGMFTNNYPVWLFNETGHFTRSSTIATETLGIRVLTTQEFRNERGHSPIASWWDYGKAVYKTISRINDTIENPVSNRPNSIPIECNHHSLVLPTPTQLSEMIHQGEVVTTMYLNPKKSLLI